MKTILTYTSGLHYDQNFPLLPLKLEHLKTQLYPLSSRIVVTRDNGGQAKLELIFKSIAEVQLLANKLEELAIRMTAADKR